jgi:hypothetical protein
VASPDIAVSVTSLDFGTIGVGLGLPGQPNHVWGGALCSVFDTTFSYSPDGLTTPSGAVSYGLAWYNADIYQGNGVGAAGASGIGAPGSPGTFNILGSIQRDQQAVSTSDPLLYFTMEENGGEVVTSGGPTSLDPTETQPPINMVDSSVPVKYYKSVAEDTNQSLWAVSVASKYLVGAEQFFVDGAGDMIDEGALQQITQSAVGHDDKLLNSNSNFSVATVIDQNSGATVYSQDRLGNVTITDNSPVQYTIENTALGVVRTYLATSPHPVGPMTIVNLGTTNVGRRFVVMSGSPQQIVEFPTNFSGTGTVLANVPAGRQAVSLRSNATTLFLVLDDGSVDQVNISNGAISTAFSSLNSVRKDSIVDVAIGGDLAYVLCTNTDRTIYVVRVSSGAYVSKIDLTKVSSVSSANTAVQSIAVGPLTTFATGSGRPIYVLFNVTSRAGGVAAFQGPNE